MPTPSRYNGTHCVVVPEDEGDGVEGMESSKRIVFLSHATVTLMTERRVSAPYGLSGGDDGQKGVNTQICVDGARKRLVAKTTLDVREGESDRSRDSRGRGMGSALRFRRRVRATLRQEEAMPLHLQRVQHDAGSRQ